MTDGRVVVQLRASEERKAAWVRAAGSLGLSEFARRVLDAACEAGGEAAVARAAVSKTAGEVVSVPARPVRPEPVRRSSVGVCAKTGFPEEVCLCPRCKKLR